jgi:hypothetical protein
MYRQPKYIYHLTKACYTDHPVIFIHPHFWREKYTGQVRDIIVDSNCDSVFLSVNGRFISKQHLLDKAFKTFVFENIKIENGFVEAVGYKNGRKYTSKVVMPGKPARIILSTSQRELIADRSGIAIIKADITDINGNPVFDATNTLHWQVTGPASLVGPEIYKSNIHNNESPEGCGYTVVPVCNLVRSHDVSGKIIIKVSSEGLDPAEIEISSIAPSKEPGTTWLFERMPKSEGRTKVQRVKIDKPVMSIKTELKPIKENVKIDASKEEEIHRAISLLIRNNSDSLFINSIGLPVLELMLKNCVIKSNKYLIADDYNYLTNQYNIFRMIERAALENRTENLIPKSKLTEYAEKIIARSEPVDIEREIEKFK